jgi:hypothetical protein
MAVASPPRATLAELAQNGSPSLRRPGNFLIREGRATCDCGGGRSDALGQGASSTAKRRTSSRNSLLTAARQRAKVASDAIAAATFSA